MEAVLLLLSAWITSFCLEIIDWLFFILWNVTIGGFRSNGYETSPLVDFDLMVTKRHHWWISIRQANQRTHISLGLHKKRFLSEHWKQTWVTKKMSQRLTKCTLCKETGHTRMHWCNAFRNCNELKMDCSCPRRTKRAKQHKEPPPPKNYRDETQVSQDNTDCYSVLIRTITKHIFLHSRRTTRQCTRN